ncbi:hypothetical protein GCM10023334_085870 [Nonomuraea thailandensis]
MLYPLATRASRPVRSDDLRYAAEMGSRDQWPRHNADMTESSDPQRHAQTSYIRVIAETIRRRDGVRLIGYATSGYDSEHRGEVPVHLASRPVWMTAPRRTSPVVSAKGKDPGRVLRGDREVREHLSAR